MPEDYNGTQIPEEQNPEHSENQNDNIPDWMKEAGWETSSGTFDESKPVFDDLDDEEEIVPADIPSWLEEAAPEGFDFDSMATPADEKEADTDSDAFIDEDIDFGAASEPPKTEELTPKLEDKPAPEEGKIDIPSWLENLELDEDSQETAVAWLENMPEDLRATDEELKAAEEFAAPGPESTQEHVDELAWMEEISTDTVQAPEQEPDEVAALSEDLVASELIPEPPEPEHIFDQQDIETYDSDAPAWLKELAEDDAEHLSLDSDQDLLPEEPVSEESSSGLLPDWLSDLSPEGEPPTAEPEPGFSVESEPQPAKSSSDEIPDWLGDFEEGDSETAASEESSETLEWLSSLSTDDTGPDAPPASGEESLPADIEEPTSINEVDQESVSPNDDTLNTQVPTWLSQIDETEEDQEVVQEVAPESEAESAADTPLPPSDSWLEQIGEDIPGEADLTSSESERDVIDWLDALGTEAAPDQADALEDLRDSLEEETVQEDESAGLETAKYLDEFQQMPEEVEEHEDASQEAAAELEQDASDEPAADDLPDWLAELSDEADEVDISLESAIRQSGRDLNEAELEFLSKSEELQADNSDWLSKLDEQDAGDSGKSDTEQEEVSELESMLSGGILDRLNDAAGADDPEALEAEMPQWLENLKKEEDPQETAVLWLQEFLEKGDQANVHDEIKRYTDELDPGDSIPKWMEDLKNEEDPQTTAMLWLEKFSATRSTPEPTTPSSQPEDSSDWLAELEREEASQADQPVQDKVSDFNETGEGWLADLDIDEKLKSTASDLPEWTSEQAKSAAEKEEEPSWMKATSPLEGDVYTDELAGEQKDVEIPAWLAGYGEGEEPEDSDEQILDSQEAQSDASDTPSGDDEYAWLAADQASQSKRKQIDINKAAISQLESILGISYQVAKGIVHYREKQGPYLDFSDLLKVPEIDDEQTIEILKPEVFIGPIEEVGASQATIPDAEPVQIEKPETTATQKAPEEKPKPVPEKKKKAAEPYQETLEKARAHLAESNIQAAVENYGKLVKKKKYLEETILDLQQATLDHPLEINLHKTLGDAYMQSDKLDEALEAYSKAEDLLA